MSPLDPATTIGSAFVLLTVPPTGHATPAPTGSVVVVSTRMLIALALVCGLAILAAFAVQVLIG